MERYRNFLMCFASACWWDRGLLDPPASQIHTPEARRRSYHWFPHVNEPIYKRMFQRHDTGQNKQISSKICRKNYRNQLLRRRHSTHWRILKPYSVQKCELLRLWKRTQCYVRVRPILKKVIIRYITSVRTWKAESTYEYIPSCVD